MHLEIRNLAIEDYDAIVALWKSAGLSYRPKGRDKKTMMQKQMATYPDFFVGAFLEEVLIGVVIGSYDGRMKGWINRLAVEPAHRRMGVALRLVDALEKTLKERGATVIGAMIEIPNKESVSFFQKMGYVSHPDILYVSKRESQEM
jgi:ribosomal protein S18 acetylase RimI-like enzyme